MYIPLQYRNENLEEVRNFMREHPFGILVNQLNGKPWATHIPLLLESDNTGKDYLVGHISKANPQWSAFSNGAKVLCIFSGPHTYISSSWYKEEEVPTWDYIAVHVYGSLEVQNNQELEGALDQLMKRFESGMECPVVFSELSRNTLKQLRGIVGFKIAVEEIQAAYKLSQGRPADHASILSNLRQSGDPAALAVAVAIENFARR